MTASNTENKHRPRLSPALWREIRLIAARRGITDAAALRGILVAGIGAMSGLNIVQQPPPPAQSADTRGA
jgi:hypothetical protein